MEARACRDTAPQKIPSSASFLFFQKVFRETQSALPQVGRDMVTARHGRAEREQATLAYSPRAASSLARLIFGKGGKEW